MALVSLRSSLAEELPKAWKMCFLTELQSNKARHPRIDCATLLNVKLIAHMQSIRVNTLPFKPVSL